MVEAVAHFRKWISLASLLASLACGASVAPPAASPDAAKPAKPAASAQAAKPTPPAFSANATAPTESQAYAEAARRLLPALLDDESLLTGDELSARLASVVHARASDPFQASSTKRGIEVEIGLRQQALGTAFSRLDAELSSILGPPLSEALASAVHAVRVAHLRRALCVRSRKLVKGSSCKPLDTSAVDQQLSELVARLSLRPAFAEGIPTRGGAYLRPLVAEAVLDHGGMPLPVPNLPVRVQCSDGAGAASLVTDANGAVSQPIPQDTPLTATWSIAFDAARWLGPLSEALPAVSTALRGRATSIARAALVDAPGKPPLPEATQALRQALRGRITEPVELAAGDAKALSEASEHKMAAVAPLLADRLRGALDTILVLQAESEFASRMGTERVWYEARGSLRAFDAWTGTVLVEVSAVVAESGFGEPRAERAAREALGRALAQRLVERLGATTP